NSKPGLQRHQLEDVHQYGFGDNEATASKESSDSDDNIAISLEMRKKNNSKRNLRRIHSEEELQQDAENSTDASGVENKNLDDNPDNNSGKENDEENFSGQFSNYDDNSDKMDSSDDEDDEIREFEEPQMMFISSEAEYGDKAVLELTVTEKPEVKPLYICLTPVIALTPSLLLGRLEKINQSNSSFSIAEQMNITANIVHGTAGSGRNKVSHMTMLKD
ncbi:putative uncharacterized protein DDB_G0270496, partial [Phlebotomus papatasi]|uniref:putative uncharacterized protein DDB_G0270496 n=1 Tax=Phlebotomus papatasi TaxID=29031 RepID=UPI002483FC25